METLVQARKRQKVSQEKIRQLTNIPQKVWSDLETGRTSPQKRMMTKVESFLGRIDWLNTYGSPNYDRRRKKIDHIDLQRKIIGALEDLDTLARRDQYEILGSLYQWMANYLNKMKEKEKMTAVHHGLFADRFRTDLRQNN